jgi:hypothetical protein
VAGPEEGNLVFISSHPHFRKGMSGMGYFEGSCRNSGGKPAARPDRDDCPGALAPPPPAPLLMARPGVLAPLAAALCESEGGPPPLPTPVKRRVEVRMRGAACSRAISACARAKARSRQGNS